MYHYLNIQHAFIMQGGVSTSEEMCLAFPVYYPRSPDRNLDKCVSYPGDSAFTNFTDKYYPLVRYRILSTLAPLLL
jgi:hypothetical protein